MSEHVREGLLRRIEENIATHGHHTTLVKQSVVPRFAYTIGMTDRHLPELILAGAIGYGGDDVGKIINSIGDSMKRGKSVESAFAVDPLGVFSLQRVGRSWMRPLMLGAAQRYGDDKYDAVQIVPDRQHSTLDTPNLASEAGPLKDCVWMWLCREWPYAVPSDALVVTNMKFLRGERATEVARWEEAECEMFAGPGPDVAPGEMRIVPIGTALGIDRTLEWILTLPVGKGGWRDGEAGDWQPWQ